MDALPLFLIPLFLSHVTLWKKYNIPLMLSSVEKHSTDSHEAQVAKLYQICVKTFRQILPNTAKNPSGDCNNHPMFFRFPPKNWANLSSSHLQHHGSIKHCLTGNLQATTSICVAFHQQFGYPLVKLRKQWNIISPLFFLGTQHFLLVHTISNGGCFHCHVGTLDVSAARCTPGGYAGWLGVSKTTGMKRDSLLEEPIHPKNSQNKSTT